MKISKSHVIAIIICASIILSTTALAIAQVFFINTPNTTDFTVAQRFSDSASFSDWYKNEVEYVNNHKLMTGYKDGSFNPNKSVTRAELAVIIKRVEAENENRLLNTLIANSNAATDELTEPYKSLITIAKASTPTIGTPEDITGIYSELKSAKFPKGYTIWAGGGEIMANKYYVSHKFTSPDSGKSLDYWYGPYLVLPTVDKWAE